MSVGSVTTCPPLSQTLIFSGSAYLPHALHESSPVVAAVGDLSVTLSTRIRARRNHDWIVSLCP